MSSFGINRRKSSHRSRKSKPFGKLTIDTKLASQGKTFPYESRVQELSFVSFEESKARKNAFSNKKNLKQQLQDRLPVHAGPRHGVPVVGNSTDAPLRSATGDIIAPASETSQQALHKRIKGLRPSPLDLIQDVSPSDQAITIGISIPSSTMSQHTWSPESPTQHLDQAFARRRSVDRSQYGHDVATPIIVITPAKDNFSPSDLAPRRPASSVYSRYTNCYPKDGPGVKTPPVPPLPLFTNTNFPKSKWSMSTAPPRESALTTFEEDLPTARIRETKLHIDGPNRSLSKASTAGLPTPRRSKGWWNVITSPFSAKSTGSHFWKSPPLDDPSDHMPILGDQSEMGLSDPHAGVIFTNRAPDDDALRSAPASGPPSLLGDDIPTTLKRSDTAPAALDHDAAAVNIYRVPSTGEAAAYYDSNRHFPSLYVQSKSMGDDLEGWSPSHSVFVPSRHSEQRSTALTTADQDEYTRQADSPEDKGGAENAPAVVSRSESNASRGIPIGETVFSSPSDDELKSAGLSRPTPARGATIDSTLSPLSATPTVEDAHIARFVGPRSSNGEQPKKVEMPTPSHYGLSFATLGAATISHRSIPPPPERPAHVRQDSYGLGISDHESKSELFPPPPRALSEKSERQLFPPPPRLGTDRFGQLTILSNDGVPAEPWFQRFFWALATGFGALMMLLIVCLVIFVPQAQQHKDMEVEAAWVNTTGFPPLPEGVMTVIQPGLKEERDTCVSQGIWSCAAATGGPNFRFEVRFRNGTMPANETQSVVKRWQEKRAVVKKRNSWSDYLYSPSPSPPSQKDQEFLGQYTDNVSLPYNGEETPFYLSLLSPVQLTKRNGYTYPYPTNDNSSDASTEASKDVPSPAVQSDGKPANPDLYPYVTAQPLRLYDRGKESEHYGFYNYFDRTVFLSGLNSSTRNTTNTTTSTSDLDNANAVCTFSQSRFLVQIWTQHNTTIATLPSDNSDAAAINSTANSFSGSGSLPYPVTLTLDRHGGEAGKKGVYCYDLDPESKEVLGSSGWWVPEDRGIGRSIVNAADVPGGNGTTSSADKLKRDDNDKGSYGGIDGGDGGCGCAWQNWK